MTDEIKELIAKFKVIRDKGLIKSLRDGTTGIGYLFEASLGKKEDHSPLPDYQGIEIKTKMGFSKNDMTLFTLIPKINNKSAIKFLLESFGYPNSRQSGFKTLRANIYYNKNSIIANKFIFRLKIVNNKLKLYIYNLKYELISNEIYWDIEDIFNRIETKLKYLAIIKGYPYSKNREKYYMYKYINIYKLRDKRILLQMIQNDTISITLNIDTWASGKRFGQIHDRGTAFKIKLNAIEILFEKVY